MIDPNTLVEFITAVDALAKQAAALDAARAALAADAAARAPQVAALVVKSGAVLPDDRDRLAGLLADPARLPSLLAKVADYHAREKLAQLGQPAPAAKRAAAGPYVGARTSAVRESDLAFLRHLGIDAPPAA